MNHKRLTLFAGHYGSGKTNIAVNYALHLAGQQAAMEQDQANWQAQYNAAQRAASSSGGGDKEESTPTSPHYSNIYNAAVAMAAKGAAKETVESYIENQKDGGRLHEAEAAKILNAALVELEKVKK